MSNRIGIFGTWPTMSGRGPLIGARTRALRIEQGMTPEHWR
ncbi:hypothetical protein [Mycobacteroides salmoniphilum]|nr:hypothetical protein [Mycobacteroides salmoniphilum]